MTTSGLDYKQRIHARDLTIAAAKLGLAHKDEIHYSQNVTLRWDWLSKDLRAGQGEFPHNTDCSGFATWCLWNGLWVPYRCKDVVNNTNWRWGNTNSMILGGVRVRYERNVLRGDVVFYGTGGPTHCAVVTGWKIDPKDDKYKPWVISNGSEPGPYFLPYSYRKDVYSIHRYI